MDFAVPRQSSGPEEDREKHRNESREFLRAPIPELAEVPDRTQRWELVLVEGEDRPEPDFDGDPDAPEQPENPEDSKEDSAAQEFYPWTGLLYWDGAETPGFQPLYSFEALGISDAGGTEKPFHRASGSRGQIILGAAYSFQNFGVLLLGAAHGQNSLVFRRSQGGLYAGMVWFGSPYISWPQPRGTQSWIRAGYQPMVSDNLGLLYDLRAPGISLGQQFQTGLGAILGFQLHALDLSDSHPYYSTGQRTGQSRYYGGELSFFKDGWLVELSYGNFRLNGQSARQEGRWQDLVLWEGQSGLPAQYVHYSGLAMSYYGQEWSLDLQFYRSHGLQSARTDYGGEEFLSRKTIRGWMAAGQLIWTFLPDQELGLSGLGSSRQRKDAEDFHGFAPLNPVPRLLGGLGSILISARPPFDQSHPLSNRRFYDSFPSSHISENGRVVNAEIQEHDLLVPDHANRGIRMAGIFWEKQIPVPGLGDAFLAIHLNRAEYKEAQGTEGILVLDYYYGKLNLTFSAAGAFITPSAETPDPYTGFIPSAKRRYFSRYAFYFLLPLE